ncbi:NADH-quinone oxidoreductase subunit L [Rhodovibrionaceae bacterium A322]
MIDVLIVFLPLAAAIIAGFFGKSLGDRGSQLVTSGALVIAAILSTFVFIDVALNGNARTTELLTWFATGSFEASWALRVDTLTAVMFCVVTYVSAVVHIYSIGYMSEDPSIPRFMAYLSLFTFAMLMLVSADNLVQMFFGWEGVGVASYLLIGFWYHKKSACDAAIKAFLVNRVGDIGFALGIALCFYLFQTAEFDTIFAQVPGQTERTISIFGLTEVHALTAACFLLFIGAMGKSAQLGLHTWLPDAMEGPTPVSALIHAATMVTAGVFMLSRLSPIFEYAPTALEFVTFIGAATAIFAATVGLTQTDIKRVIAYSTCSQLGYMFFAIGVGAYNAAMFHLTTHAFFKALLFLGAGAVIHAMHHEQDMRRMGGLYKKIPVTYALMWIGTLALIGFGIPGLGGFAGFYSKDMIIEVAYAKHSGMGNFAFVMGVLAALLTSFYSFRLLFLTFHGKTRADAHTFDHAHEAPKVMMLPLTLLVIGSIFAGGLLYSSFVGSNMDAFWNGSIVMLTDIIDAAHHVPLWVKLSPLVMTVLGFVLAYIMYIAKPGMADACARTFRPLYLMSFNKWYFDELYDKIFIRPALWLGRGFWKAGDVALIDGVGPNGVAEATVNLAKRISRLQSGYLYHYAFAMLIGVVVFATWYIMSALG